jgi:hypothetical protein
MTNNRMKASPRLQSVLAVGLISLYCAHAGAQPGPVPEYIAGLADFQVARLDGSLAPSNGNVSIRTVTPSEWLTNDPSVTGLAGIIVAWNGGAKGTGSRLFVHGGGHNDSANNGVYIYDFAGTARPTGWSAPITISPVSAVVPQSPTYSDGFPTSVHTYDGVVYARHNNHIYRFNGAIYGPTSGFTSASFKHNVATREWTRLPNVPSGAGGAVTIYDPVTGNIFVSNASTNVGNFFRTSNDSWSDDKSFGGNGIAESAGAWDPTRNRGVVIGANKHHVISLNFANETASATPIAVSGATEILERQGLSVVYDPNRDSYWIFGGREDSVGWSNLYEMPASGNPWTVVAHQITGEQIERTPGLIGSYGRFTLMDQWRAIGFVASHTSAAYVIKLPSGTFIVKAPQPPVSVAAQ